jgi:hypothetical protein
LTAEDHARHGGIPDLDAGYSVTVPGIRAVSGPIFIRISFRKVACKTTVWKEVRVVAQVNWGDSEALWLNLTNAGLGLVVLICFVLIAVSTVRQLAGRRRRRERAMADGGEPIDQNKKAKP